MVSVVACVCSVSSHCTLQKRTPLLLACSVEPGDDEDALSARNSHTRTASKLMDLGANIHVKDGQVKGVRIYHLAWELGRRMHTHDSERVNRLTR